jgi:hypothetical protein
MARRGLNAKLSYTVDGQKYSFDVRAGDIMHGVRMVADEATSRTRRAYYPHRLSAAPFTVQVLINGYNERVAFSNFLNDYAQRALDPNLAGRFPQMAVSIPSRNFQRSGVPLNGIAWGTHTGAFVWKTAVTFETTIDWNLGDTANPGVSTFSLSASATSRAPELKYFYPSGIQLSGSEVPPSGDYTKPVGPSDIAGIISGGTSGGSDAGDVPPNPWANKPPVN